MNEHNHIYIMNSELEMYKNRWSIENDWKNALYNDVMSEVKSF